MMLTGEQRSEATLNMLTLIARLKPGATVAQANAEVQSPLERLLEGQASQSSEKERPGLMRQRAAVIPARTFQPAQYSYSQPLFVLMGSLRWSFC